jgi:hypothetical protein
MGFLGLRSSDSLQPRLSYTGFQPGCLFAGLGEIEIPIGVARTGSDGGERQFAATVLSAVCLAWQTPDPMIHHPTFGLAGLEIFVGSATWAFSPGFHRAGCQPVPVSVLTFATFPLSLSDEQI